jgi:hypothetical protein
VAMSVAALMAILLLGVEAATWAAAYRLLGALPDNKLAMLYSLRRCSSMRRFGGRASASLGNDVRVVIRLATGIGTCSKRRPKAGRLWLGILAWNLFVDTWPTMVPDLIPWSARKSGSITGPRATVSGVSPDYDVLGAIALY